MRVISGRFRGKKLAAPRGKATRPTSDRAKETLFNILQSQLMKAGKNWVDVTFTDVFAGSGAVGIEALSRGATAVTFFESDAAAQQCIQENAGEKISLFSDALNPPVGTPQTILFLDPPYQTGLWRTALAALNKQGWIDSTTLIVVEIDQGEDTTLPAVFELTQTRSEGRNTFLFLRRTS